MRLLVLPMVAGRRLEQLPTLAQEVLEMERERGRKEGETVVLGSQISRRFQGQVAGLDLDKAALQLTVPPMKAPGWGGRWAAGNPLLPLKTSQALQGPCLGTAFLLHPECLSLLFCLL